jgi:hypothetical protein
VSHSVFATSPFQTSLAFFLPRPAPAPAE